MDFGYPQTTESKILQESVVSRLHGRNKVERLTTRLLASTRRYITQESHKLEVQVRPPMAVTNAVSWRSEGIRYRKNEVFLDVVESVNLLVRPVATFLLDPWRREADPPSRPSTGQCKRQRCPERDSWRDQDEVLPLGHARTATRSQRQGHVRKHRTK